MPRKEASNLTSFETEFERLNAIVEKLEQGNVPLAEMLSLYEEAMALAEKLKAVLNEAELKVEKLAAVHEEVSAEKIQGNDILENEDLF
jgi:exodeoxyribonuclease VII small subunit